MAVETNSQVTVSEVSSSVLTRGTLQYRPTEVAPFSGLDPLQKGLTSSTTNSSFSAASISDSVLIRSSMQQAAASVGVAAGTTLNLTTFYRKRARDTGALTLTFITWVTTDPTANPETVPFVGPLADVTITDVWQL